MIKIREKQLTEQAAILDVWYRSAKATHHFLTEQDLLVLYQALKDQWLDAVSIWVLVLDNNTDSIMDSKVNTIINTTANQQIVAFIGMDHNKIEMLFVDADYQGLGYGKQLMDFAKSKHQKLLVDVNEQNPAVLDFYLKQGFTIVGRSDTDSSGAPFPLLHMQN